MVSIKLGLGSSRSFHGLQAQVLCLLAAVLLDVFFLMLNAQKRIRQMQCCLVSGAMSLVTVGDVTVVNVHNALLLLQKKSRPQRHFCGELLHDMAFPYNPFEKIQIENLGSLMSPQSVNN